jgi:hypothetical protein
MIEDAPTADGTSDATDTAHLAVFGGSTALMLGLSEWTWTSPRDGVTDAPGYSRLGCGILTDGVRAGPSIERPAPAVDLDPERGSSRPPIECTDWQAEWSRAVTRNGVDIALVLFGAWDASDWKLDGDDEWRTVGDAVIDTLVRERLAEGIDLLVGSGAHQVILATTPTVGPGASGQARTERGVPIDHDERIHRFNELLRSVARDHPSVTLVEYGASIDALNPIESGRLMPDGVHPTDASAGEIWSDHLGPLVEDLLAGWNERDAT